MGGSSALVRVRLLMLLDVDIKPVNLKYHRFYSKFLNFPQGENFPPGGRLPQLYPNFFFPPGEIFPRTGYQNTLRRDWPGMARQMAFFPKKK